MAEGRPGHLLQQQLAFLVGRDVVVGGLIGGARVGGVVVGHAEGMPAGPPPQPQGLMTISTMATNSRRVLTVDHMAICLLAPSAAATSPPS